MIKFTHVFINETRQIVPRADADDVVTSIPALAFGFSLLDLNRVQFDKNGYPCRRAGGWSYGHIRRGFICAGSGGLNSMRVKPITTNH